MRGLENILDEVFIEQREMRCEALKFHLWLYRIWQITVLYELKKAINLSGSQFLYL